MGGGIADLRRRTDLFGRKKGGVEGEPPGCNIGENLNSGAGTCEDSPRQEPCRRHAPTGGAEPAIDKEAESAAGLQASRSGGSGAAWGWHLQATAAAATYRQVTPGIG